MRIIQHATLANFLVFLLAAILFYNIWVRLRYGEVLFDIINCSLSTFTSLAVLCINIRTYTKSRTANDKE